MPKPFDDACFTLPIGKPSGVVQSPYGFHVFKVLGRRAAKRRSLDEVRAEIERRATADKRAQAERQLLAQVRKEAEVKVDEAAFALLR
jgi:peptidyl-prolyl cis-trans isomerase C